MLRPTLSLIFVLCLLTTPACDIGKLTGTGTPAIVTTQSIWVSASWGGGRTGTPLESKGVTPNNLNGAYCPATSVLLYNHTSPIAGWASFGGLILKNNCNVPVSYLVCATAGGSSSNGIPSCAVDPRMTLIGNMISVDLGAGEFTYVGNTSLDAGVNVFYCPSSNQFTLGIVKSAAPTDCWKP